MNDDPYRRLLQALRDHGLRVDERGRDSASAQCPVHGDKKASMTVGRGHTQPVVIDCKAGKGCTYDDVIDALGIPKEELSKPRDESRVWTPYGDAVAVYTYRDEAGQLLYEVCRTADKQFPVRVPDPTSKSGWRWKFGNTRRVLYRLPELLRVQPGSLPIYLCEGEKDVHAVESTGNVATTAPGGSGAFSRTDPSALAGHYVYAIVDRPTKDDDTSGDKWAADVERALRPIVKGLKFVRSGSGKDAHDHLSAGLSIDAFVPYEPPVDHLELADAVTVQFDEPARAAVVEQSRRRVDLKPWLDGTYEPPQPAVGGRRGDGRRLLYPGRWHTLIAPTTSGKSWWAVWHAVDELRTGHTVVYAHFEEADPGGTLDRIRTVAPDIAIDDLIERFVWLDCTRRWSGPGEFAREIPDGASLAVLDGINAACAQHGWPVDKPEAVGQYRAHFAAPVIAAGGTPLSLGHPPKARDRQDERHGYGSTAWLDEVDGVGFRLKPSKDNPIRRGRHGWSSLYVVKDRYGQVEQHCVTEQDGSSEGWFYAGALHVDGAAERLTAYCSAPETNQAGTAVKGPVDQLAEKALQVLVWDMGSRFASTKSLNDQLRAAGARFRKETLDVALTILSRDELIYWPEGQPRAPRPGRATDAGVSLATELGRFSGSQDQTPEALSPWVPPKGGGTQDPEKS